MVIILALLGLVAVIVFLRAIEGKGIVGEKVKDIKIDSNQWVTSEAIVIEIEPEVVFSEKKEDVIFDNVPVFRFKGENNYVLIKDCRLAGNPDYPIGTVVQVAHNKSGSASELLIPDCRGYYKYVVRIMR